LFGSVERLTHCPSQQLPATGLAPAITQDCPCSAAVQVVDTHEAPKEPLMQADPVGHGFPALHVEEPPSGRWQVPELQVDRSGQMRPHWRQFWGSENVSTSTPPQQKVLVPRAPPGTKVAGFWLQSNGLGG
jgi:hypothetical protein